MTCEGVEYQCSNRDLWPPAEVIAYKSELIDPLPPGVPVAEGFRGVLPDVTYQRIRTWEQVCGLLEMSEDKCPTCPHVEHEGSVKDGRGRHHTARSLKLYRQQKPGTG